LGSELVLAASPEAALVLMQARPLVLVQLLEPVQQ
jgi:hypothetical protein